MTTEIAMPAPQTLVPADKVTLENPATWAWPSALSDAEAMKRLTYLPILSDQRLTSASREERIAAQSLVSPYAPTSQALRAFQNVLAKGRYSLSLRNPEDSKYRSSLISMAGSLSSRRTVLMPPSPIRDTERTTGIVLAGVSGMGRHSLLRRIAGELEETPRPVPRLTRESLILRQVPAIYLAWPASGDPDEFHFSFRALIDGLVDTPLFDDAMARNFKTKHLNPSTRAVALLVSAGVILVDGINSNNFFRTRSPDLLAYLANLQDYTGIPVVTSCTYPVLMDMARMPDVGSRLGADTPYKFDYLEFGEEWCRLVEIYWNQCSLCTSYPVPQWLSEKFWNQTFGNLRFLSIVMRGLHLALLEETFEVHEICEAIVEDIARTSLISFTKLLKILSRIRNGKNWRTSEEERAEWEDYLPQECFMEV